ncbi:hypothetical protein RRG08_007578, partial [Elysia crispata]
NPRARVLNQAKFISCDSAKTLAQSLSRRNSGEGSTSVDLEDCKHWRARTPRSVIPTL